MKIQVQDVIDTTSGEWTGEQVAKLQKALDAYEPDRAPTVTARDVFLHRETHHGSAPEAVTATSVQDAAAQEEQMSAVDLMNFRDTHQGCSPTEWASRGGAR
ncbi:MAG TPA: hypothetical protein VHO67_04735 [Polyangia bacterium]|nr:hypothetical protein [Polyangia bacterium]